MWLLFTFQMIRCDPFHCAAIRQRQQGLSPLFSDH